MKYKYNGQWVEVSIKALDSMPVGTMVEFAGGTIPSGWTQVNDYSTDEIDTGKTWIDGKEIYRKVYTGATTTVSQYNMIDSNFSYDIVGITGYFLNETTGNISQIGGQYRSDGSYTFTICNKTQTHIQLFNSSSSNVLDYTLIIEYTKTTNQE